MPQYRNSPLNWIGNRFVRSISSLVLRAEVTFDAADTAVILVDCQNDLLTADGRGRALTAGTEAAAAVVSTLVRLLAAARRSGLRVVYTRQAELSDPAAAPRHLVPAQLMMQREGMFAASQGAEIHQRLTPQPNDEVRPAHIGLSAFTDTDLAPFLRTAGVARVVIAGAVTEVSVDSTARDAVEHGFQTTVIVDGCLPSSTASGQRGIRVTLSRIVHAVISCADFERRLTRKSPRGTRGATPPS